MASSMGQPPTCVRQRQHDDVSEQHERSSKPGAIFFQGLRVQHGQGRLLANDNCVAPAVAAPVDGCEHQSWYSCVRHEGEADRKGARHAHLHHDRCRTMLAGLTAAAGELLAR